MSIEPPVHELCNYVEIYGLHEIYGLPEVESKRCTTQLNKGKEWS